MLTATYPGQRWRRGTPLAALAIVLALGIGLVSGWAIFHDQSRSGGSKQSPCPGSQHHPLERAHAAACLLDGYLALVDQPKPVRDGQLAQIVLPPRLSTERATYRTLGTAPVNPPGKPAQYAKIDAEYATVAAVKLNTTSDPGTYRSPDVGFTAWVAIVDSYANASTPLCNWYLGHFALRWWADRWWLSDRFHADENATPMSYPQDAGGSAFGPGWVGA